MVSMDGSSAECDGTLLGRLALEKIEKRAEAAIGIGYGLAILEPENLEGDLVVGLRAASGAVLVRHVVSDILSES